MRFWIVAATLSALPTVVVNAAGLASGDNFSVITPATPTQADGDKYANLVLHRAEDFRETFAKEWLGTDLTSSGVRTVISVSFSATENSGMTLAKDDPAQRFHNIFVESTPERAAGTMLRHEIAHTVLATAFPYPNRLPPWVEEGIASRYDNTSLMAMRQQEVRSWLRSKRFPSVANLFTMRSIAAFDDAHYAAAESVVAYLLTRGDKPTLIRFADEGRQGHWDLSLRTHYHIDGCDQLQRDWQAWLVESAP